MRRIISVLLALLLLLPASALAGDSGFVSDVDRINEAAKSVLKLEVSDHSELIATGSAFVILNSNTIITNYHVIEDGNGVVALCDDGRVYRAERLLIADPEKDLAILSLESAADLTPLELSEKEIRRAAPVVAIGSPKGILNTVSMGNISGFFEEDGIRYVQFTAPISSGSSGGALLDDTGCVIGITSAAYDDGQGIIQNINFAVSVDDIRELVDRLPYYASVSLQEFGRGMLPSASNTLNTRPPATDPNRINDLPPSQRTTPEPQTTPGPVDPSGDGSPVLIYENSTPDEITALQEKLIALGWLAADAPNGVYDDATREAVSAFQSYVDAQLASAGLSVTGYIDVDTFLWLNGPNAPANPDRSTGEGESSVYIYITFRQNGSVLLEDEDDAEPVSYRVSANTVTIYDDVSDDTLVFTPLPGGKIQFTVGDSVYTLTKVRDAYTASSAATQGRPGALVGLWDWEGDLISIEVALENGNRGDDITTLQQALIAGGYLDGEADGIFGRQTAAAVRSFKENNALPTNAYESIVTGRMMDMLYGGASLTADEPVFALAIPDGSTGEWEKLSDGSMNFRIQVKNISSTLTVSEFDLVLYATDARGQRQFMAGESRTLTTTVTVTPGQTVYSAYCTLPASATIAQVYAAISRVAFPDGTSLEAEEPVYFYWEIK